MEGMHIDADDSLSLAAVGLWHKLQNLHGVEFSSIDVLTVHPDPNAWGPFDEKHDLEGPLNELIAIGYIEELPGDRLHLWETV